ncbi:hypothetical protein BDV38DRAFT_291480 [Aspergillus pseudotamarii]|uniref:DUF6603 domain-containing protein n=1 Tax=Aspergillus pseudotamarii TaxID=132259 RepID=A0A5N6SXT6_ASPPS|nr:uncharacterized protein BDV38DRAFT_291480 [Aspergillus pseudotamarii]KAE8139475.1 hypothetical protein BDV38DRAFT_291480 [Aspergillus pseudotamarii]
MSKFRVDSIHISVVIGDSAIHLLVEDAKGKPKVLAAVLIDGGDDIAGGGGAAAADGDSDGDDDGQQQGDRDTRFVYLRRKAKKHSILSTITWIEKKYDCSEMANKRLQFDSIVITHWDRDHYHGIGNILMTEARGGNVPTKLSWLKWGPNNTPETYLYAPTHPATKTELLGTFTFDTEDTEKKVIRIAYKKEGEKKKTHEPFAQFRSTGTPKNKTADGLWGVLGVNFFNNKKLTDETPDDTVKPTALVKSNPPDNPAHPALYCVGVRYSCLVKGTWDLTGRRSSDDATAKGHNPHIVPGQRAGEINEVSIAAMVMWKGVDSKSPPRVSHYFAGDLGQDEEDPILTWLESDNINRITSMKASHHGATNGTPIDMFKRFQPVNTYLPSSTKVKHGHPSWEFVFAWNLYCAARAAREKVARLVCAAYPPYLWQENGKYNDKDLADMRLLGLGEKGAEFRDTLRAQLKEINDARSGRFPVDNEYEKYVDKDEDTQRRYIAERLAAILKLRAFPTADYHPALNSGYVKRGSCKNKQQGLDLVLIRSYAEETKDGDFLYKDSGSDELAKIPAITNNTLRRSSRLKDQNQQATRTKRKTNQSVPPGVPKKKKSKKGYKAGDGETDAWLLGVVEVSEGTFYVPPETNPDEMGPGDDDEEDEDDSSIAAPTSIQGVVNRVSTQARRHITGDPIIPANGYYLFTSTVDPSDIDADIEHQILPPGPLDEFVDALHCGVLCLVEKPEVSAETTLEEGVDEWGCWIQDVLGAQTVSVVRGADDDEGGFTINSWRMQIPLQPIESELENPDPTLLDLTTDLAVLEKTFGPTEFVDENGFLTESNVLVFGLSGVASGPTSVAINKIIEFIGLRDWFGDPSGSDDINPFIAVLGMLEVKVPSTVDEAEEGRNAVWFTPGDTYRTTIRLQLPLQTGGQAELNEKFLQPFKISLDETTVIARRSSTWSTKRDDVVVETQGSLILRARAKVNGDITLDAILEFNATLTTITLTNSTLGAVTMDSILGWVANALGLESSFDFMKLQDRETSSFRLGQFEFRRIILDLVRDPVTGKETISSFSLHAEVTMRLGQHAAPILFHLTYTYDAVDGSTVRARLWGRPPSKPSETEQLVQPEYEDFHYLAPITIEEADWVSTLDLIAIGGFETAPAFLPTQVLQAEFIANQEGLYMTGTLVPKPAEGSGTVPIFTIADATLEIWYDWEQSQPVARVAGPGFSGGFYVKALLSQPKGSRYGAPTQITGAVTYESKDEEWQLYGSMDHFFASTLAQFFSEDVRGAVIPMIESIEVRGLEVIYSFSNQAPSEFAIRGNLVLDQHVFSLAYTHSGNTWDFTAGLRIDQDPSVESNAGGMLASFLGEDLKLPEFLVNIMVPTSTRDLMEIKIESKKLNGNIRNSVIVIATWLMDDRLLQFIQFRQVPEQGGKPGPVRRIVIASLSAFPAVNVPMIGDITQPFDQALFLWARAEGGDGIPKGELEGINDILRNSTPAKPTVPFKVLGNRDRDDNDADVVLANGLHFMVVAFTTRGFSEVIIDYTFQTGKESGTKAVISQGDTEKGGRMEPFSKNVGPLQIKSLGLRYSTGLYNDESILSIRIDASIMVGPIEFSLVGFSIDLNFTNGTSLHSPPGPEFTLEGLQAVYDRPPIEIAGMLHIGKEPEREYYQGALMISYMPWQFQAAGYWGYTTKKGIEQFETVFVYCVLRGPLITFQFVSIEGICGGFGYNSKLTYPTAKEVIDFPLIKDGATPGRPDGDTPLQALENMLDTKWFAPQDKSFWVAAGLTVKAFQILHVQAVVAVQWNPYVELGIFAVATASIPGGKSGRQFAFVQLGIVATVNLESGILKVEGELTPASYILDPSCHLSGGFALYSWFDSKDTNLRGDWVFTIGGYHPSYQKPSQYPAVDRLGISWQFGKSVSITGNAYFAITPKTCMGGGRLELKLSLNPLYAWFIAFVDFLINYKPFFFMAEGGVSVGVQFTLDLWLVTIKIHVELSARLYIQGPPISGTVHVNFYVFGFDIDFGTNSSARLIPRVPQPFSLPHRRATSPRLDSYLWSKSSPHLARFSVNCKFPIENATVVTLKVSGEENGSRDVYPSEKVDTLSARPMHKTGSISSILTITIQRDGENELLEEKEPDPIWDDNEAIYGDVPAALFGKYDASTDPGRVKNPQSLLKGTSEKTLRVMTGVRLRRPGDKFSKDPDVTYKVELFQISNITPMYKLPESEARSEALEGVPWPDTPGSNNWETVRNQWKSPGGGERAGQQAADLWQELGLTRLGWDTERIKGSDSTFTGCQPQRLIDNLEKHYLWAPLLTRG